MSRRLLPSRRQLLPTDGFAPGIQHAAGDAIGTGERDGGDLVGDLLEGCQPAAPAEPGPNAFTLVKD